MRIVIGTKQELQQLILHRIAIRPPVGTFADNLDRSGWLDPSAKNGVNATLRVQYAGYNYRINANTDIYPLAEMVADMNSHALTGLSMTKTLGERVDTCNRKAVRKGIYFYRLPR